MVDKIYDRVQLVIGIDTRSMVLFRISIGCVILYDLLVRISSIEAHYTDSGIVSRHVLKGISENPLLISLSNISGGQEWQYVVFILGIAAATFLVLGYRTRIATLGCIVALLSIHVRNPFINNLGDWFLLQLLFWGALLPLGSMYSLDSKRKGVSRQYVGQICNLATLGTLLFIAGMYFFSVIYKISPIWHTEKTAVYYALSLDRFITPFGELIRQLPFEWLQLLTSIVLILERWGAVLVFLPFATTRLRIIVAVCFMAFHLGLAMSLDLGIFPFVCICAWILFLPGSFWEFCGEKLKPFVHYNFYQTIADKDMQLKASIQSRLELLISVVLIWVVLSSNMLHSGKMSVYYYEGVYRYVEPLVNSINLKQRWNMFSPHPSKRDGWFLFVGIKADGTMIDIAGVGDRISWERPSNISGTYSNQRWRKNLEWAMTTWDPHARLIGEFYSRRWNAKCIGDCQIKKYNVYFMSENNTLPNEPTMVEKKLLYSSE